MNETSLKHLYDALSAEKLILQFTSEIDYEDYCEDELVSSAVERKFEIIGEALNRIKKQSPEDLDSLSEWPAIIGFRNILAHAYDHVEDSVVWGIVTQQIPAFITELESIPELTSLD